MFDTKSRCRTLSYCTNRRTLLSNRKNIEQLLFLHALSSAHPTMLECCSSLAKTTKSYADCWTIVVHLRRLFKTSTNRLDRRSLSVAKLCFDTVTAGKAKTKEQKWTPLRLKSSDRDVKSCALLRRNESDTFRVPQSMISMILKENKVTDDWPARRYEKTWNV